METLESRELLAVDVLTYHNDLGRTGANTQETILTRANVNTAKFGKKLSLAVRGQVYAQPLVVSQLQLPNKTKHDVVYVATERNQVYAFDANTGALIWQYSAMKKGQIPIPAIDTGADSIQPDIGITSTPVIDRARGAIYVFASLKNLAGTGPRYEQKLICLDLATGAVKFHKPITVTASAPGTGSASINGSIKFATELELQRAALTLVNGVVYIAFASHADLGAYHGWVLGYNATTFQLKSVWNPTADGNKGGIWLSGGGISADAAGNLYIAVGNGTFDANTGGRDYGDSLVRIPTKGAFKPADSFTPFNQATLESVDHDFGSTGVLLLPDQPGAHPHELIVGGKEGKLYLLDRDNLGKFHSGFDNAVQVIQPGSRHGGFDTPAYYGGRVYYAASNGKLEAFALRNGRLSSIAATGPQTYGFPGANPSVSANGSRNGIVWVTGKTGNGRAVLEAYSSADLSNQLYTSELAGSRYAASGYVKFTSPTIANGRVFVGTNDHLEIYGLL